MNTIFMNFIDFYRFYRTYRLLLNLIEKISLYQILAYTIHGKIWKSYIRTINLKYQLQHGMENLNYIMDHVLYQIFKNV